MVTLFSRESAVYFQQHKFNKTNTTLNNKIKEGSNYDLRTAG